MGKAKAVVPTAEVLATSGELDHAMRTGRVSRDQAAAIASAEQSSPGAARRCAARVVPRPERKTRRARLEAEQQRDLATRQHDARSARSFSDELGMVNVYLALEPHVGHPIVARAEAEAARIATGRRKEGEQTEPFERCLADAYATLLSGAGRGPARRPELVVLVSHEVAQKGWKSDDRG